MKSKNSTHPLESRRGFHVMTKPVGPKCNLNCSYCFYLEKEKLFSGPHSFRMDDKLLEQYIREYIASQPGPEVSFAWQGGEPTLLGLDFFRRVVSLQKKYGPGRKIENALQTNGTLLDADWGDFLHRHQFLVGISIDGPRRLHDAYRVDKRDRPTFDRVRAGVEILKKHHVAFNTLTVVNRLNAKHPWEVYRFLKIMGSRYMQFIPLVERIENTTDTDHKSTLAEPPQVDEEATATQVTPWSVLPEDYGNFLTEIYQRWVERDVGKIYVQMFDATLGAWVGAPSSLCVFAPTCGNALAMEHNGDVYSCDHYVYPDYRLGNLQETDFQSMLQLPRQQRFGNDKFDRLPSQCRQCEYLFACYGGCPKHRFNKTSDGEPGLNYLCRGYKHFFKNSEASMKRMREYIRTGRSPADIMHR